MSKYIPKKGNTVKRIPLSDTEFWTTRPLPSEKFEYTNPLASEKKRIESIPLEEVTFREIYKFPLRSTEYGSWVYDANTNFVFQFEFRNKEVREKILSILNGESEPSKYRELRFESGMIQVLKDDIWLDVILVRGWGNLTGSGAYNLNSKYAERIQDTFAEFIIKKLAGLE